MSSSSISPKAGGPLLAPALPGVAQMPWPGWHRVELTLRCDRLASAAHGGKRRRRTGDVTLPPEADADGDSGTPGGAVLGEPLLAVLKAVWKHTARNAGGLLPACYGPADPVPLALTPTLGGSYALRLIFAEQDVARVQAWQEALQKHLNNKKHNYSVTQMAEPEWRTWETLLAEPLELDLKAEELCLDFLTPMFFNKPTPASGLPPHA